MYLGRFAEKSNPVGLWSDKFGLWAICDIIPKLAALVISEASIWRLKTSEAAWPSGLRRWF